MGEPHSSHFRVITTNILGVRIFRKFIVPRSVCPKIWDHYCKYSVTHPLAYPPDMLCRFLLSLSTQGNFRSTLQTDRKKPGQNHTWICLFVGLRDFKILSTISTLRFLKAGTYYARRYMSNWMIHVQWTFCEIARALNKFWLVES